jgi:two-component system CheB/CheR fusion protein
MTRRMVLKKIENIEEYSKYVKSHPEEAQALFDDLLIGVTEFFREPKTFTVLQEMVFPELFKNRSEKQPIRVWVPGCSTGEEVYSVAIALQEFLDQKMSNLTIQVFGTDVNEKNIEKARKGVYLKGLEDQVPEDLLRKFFVRSNGNYQIAKRIRDLCIFARHDIAKDPPFSGMDLIMCRNLLVYFDNVLQERVIPSFHYGLKPNGYLVLGEAEAVGKFASIFEPVEKKRPIYRKKATQEAIEFPIQKFEFAPREKREIEKQAAPDVLSQLNGKVDSLLTLMFVPATFIINSTLDVVSVRGQVQPYITMEPGAPSFSIAKVLRKELRPSVQTVIYRSRKENRAMQDTVSFTQDKLKRKVRIHIEPLTLPKVETSFFLLLKAQLKRQRSKSQMTLKTSK